MALEAANNQMMPDNSYMNFQMPLRSDMPSTSNSQVMSNFSIDEINQQNSNTPPMMNQQPQENLINFSQPPVSGYQQSPYQNNYGSTNNGPSSSQPMINNGNAYFHQQNGNNSKMNTPTYSANATPFPNQMHTSGFNGPNGFMPGQQPGMMQQFHGGNMSNHPTPTYPPAPGNIQQTMNHQDSIDNNDQQQMYMRPPSGQNPDMYYQQMKMQGNSFLPHSQKLPQKRALCFNTDMLNQMSRSVSNREVDNPQTWHQNYEQNQKPTRKRKLSNSSSSPMYNGSLQQQQQHIHDFNQSAQATMAEFQQPMSISSNPPSVHDPNAGPSINGMMQKPFKQEMKKEEDDPIRGLERMTNQTLDPSTNKAYMQRKDSKRYEDKQSKLAKLETIATNLNLQDYPPNMNMRVPMPMGMPSGPSIPPNVMNMMHPSMRPPYFNPNFDPNMTNVRPGIMPPNAMMYPPNSAMVSPGMSPAHMPPNMMQIPPYGMPGAPSPKYGPNMINRPTFNPADGMPRPPMNPELQQQIWIQQQRVQQQQMMMIKQQEVAAGGIYSQT